ncbi:Proline-rich protein 2 [Raphanus sativus]|uniref:Proline-rich protein 2 n=1 Tax=Raphanus sativus TaxID=3726 RepID=A0A6J0LPT9_RAPSA|nr:proline-rich protein 2 [Raphanus sativus]KAJ4902690.1 Proline-rich protein 2 [Raphanus sativus]
MRILSGRGGGAFCLLFVLVLCSAVRSLGRDVDVVGYAESNKNKSPHAYLGLRVTIECKAAETKDHFVTRGSGEVDETGKFSLSIPHDDMVGEDGNLKEACYAQLHSASGNPCPAHDGIEASKIVILSKDGENHVLGIKQNLKFSPEICFSKFLWDMPKFPLPPPLKIPPFPKIKKPCPPKIKLPPLLPIYKPPVVIPKKPFPPKIAHKPSVPTYKPPVPIYKPPVPIYKPPVPIYKPPVVIPKKPCPPLHKPIYKPPVPIYKPPVVIPKKPCPPKAPLPKYKPIYKPPVPIYKPPVVIPKKPCPPKAKVPIYKPPVPIYKPIYKPPVVIPKKPCPPLPKLPPFPPKYIPHPKFGKWPPFPSHP